MKDLYSKRNNLRQESAKTYSINRDMYCLLIHICNKYVSNIAGKFPLYCPDNNRVICGVDKKMFCSNLKILVPDLNYDYDYNIEAPVKGQSFNQFDIFDCIEYIAEYMQDVEEYDYHSYFQHNHLRIKASDAVFKEFQQEINDTFNLTGLLYVLTDDKKVERVTTSDELIESAKLDIVKVKEDGLKKLLVDAVSFYKSPRPDINHTAIEKLWDALERVKTILNSSNKRLSTDSLIDLMSLGNADFKQLFTDEFKALTNIGNNYRIRHHETNKIEIFDNRYYDYLFTRCFSLVALAIKFI